MEAVTIPGDWNVDQILDDLDQHGFSLLEHTYPSSYQQAVAQECLSHLNEFRHAAIQNGIVNEIRSDHILWLTPKLSISQQHILSLTALSQQLNRAFYLGINDVEAHFACYNAGEFYALHRDNPQGKNGRMISSVYYLHDTWQDDWGGELNLQDKHGVWHTIQPKPNRLVLFQSDLLHQVFTSKQQRLSITAWLRSDNSIF